MGVREEPAPAAVAVAAPEAALPDDVGVSAAEAAALIPEDLPSWRTRPRMYASTLPVAPMAPVAPTSSVPTVAPSPYPEDVRLRGEVPEGAKPFQPEHDEPRKPSARRDESAVPALHDWAPEIESRADTLTSRKDLALPEERLEGDPALEMPETIGRRREAREAEELSRDAHEIRLEDAIPSEAQLAREESAGLPRPSWEQPDMFEADGEPVDAYGTPLAVLAEIEAEEEADEDVVPSGEEASQVTLQPVAAPRRKKARAKPGPDDHAQLIAEIGCLLLDRGRVAVSMLQKHYGMDFDEATKLLDELQELGLIGPYLGGQRRDILLTRDEWLEKVSSL